MDAPATPLTVAEVRMAERVGLFLLPLLRDAIAQRTKGSDAASVFARDFASLQRARDALPDTAGPMARVELDAQMLALAERFAATHTKR